MTELKKVVAICSVDNVAHSISQKCTLEVRDKHNKVIKNSHTTFSKKKITVNAEILKEKEVSLSVTSVGNVEEGYQMTDISLSSDTVKIYGAEIVIDSIEKIEIGDVIDVEGKNTDTTFQVDLTKYLPNGVEIDGDVNLKVIAKIEKLNTKSFKISTSDIDIKNLSNNLTAEFENDTIEVTLRGTEDIIGQVSKESLKASVDLKGYNDNSTVKVPVPIDDPEGLSVDKDVNVKIRIK